MGWALFCQQLAFLSVRAKDDHLSAHGKLSGQGNRVNYVATQSRSEGPVVISDRRFTVNGSIEGHQRWSIGLLVDGCEVPNGTSINLRNRGVMGTGHGWAIG
jgi:hypothetical protein